MESATGWASAHTAQEYADFASTHEMYRRTSADLVDRLQLAPDSRVLDLCAGTGVTTEALLARLGPAGTVVAVDGSAAMLEQASARVRDERVGWVEGRAEQVADLVDGPFDAAVCNSAIWQTELASTVPALAGLLRPDARFACNIGRGFLMMPFTEAELTRTKPGVYEVMTAYAVLDLDYTPPLGGRRGGPPLTPEGVVALLESAGLAPDPPELVTYPQPAAEAIAWLRIPVFTEQLFPGLDYATRMRLLDKAVAHGAAEQRPLPWVVFTATRS